MGAGAGIPAPVLVPPISERDFLFIPHVIQVILAAGLVILQEQDIGISDSFLGGRPREVLDPRVRR